mmetsp:Transcript_13222/g.23649  ORF Transcript_13222/g.23649 Transcript_13222/m.23649 type:complete len:317 (-) Transcript_13222:59-1009(-)
MSLVNIDLSIRTHVEKSLLGVNITFRRNPTGGVHRTTQRFIIQILPLHCQGNRVLRLHSLGMGHPRGRSAGNSNRSRDTLQSPFRKINVMRVQIIGNIRRLARPSLEGFQLVLRLRHVSVHVLKVAKLRPGAIACIGVKGIPSLVHFHGDQYILLLGGLDEVYVMFESLDDGFGYHDVHSLVDAGEGDVVVGVVGGEDDGNVSGFEGGDGIDVSFWVCCLIGGVGVTTEIHIFVDITNVLLHVLPYSREFLAIDTTHAYSLDLTPPPQIEHRECYYTGALVTVGCRAADVSRCVFARAHHQHVGLGVDPWTFTAFG